MLTNGYVTALDHGTGYRVVGARDQARQALHDSAVHGWLADTDDPGALLLALLLQPAPPPRRRRCSDRRLAMASLHAGRLGLPGARMSERLRSGCLSAAGVGYCV